MYRKPCLGMFDQFMEDNKSIIDIFYVGDAAGRKGDHSASDAKFAWNAGIEFFTPEAYFLKEPNKYPDIIPLSPPENIKLRLSIPEKTVVIFIGPPGSGKSSLALKLQEKYEDLDVISNDQTGSASKSSKMFRMAIKGESPRIIIDNLNASMMNRAEYCEMAKDNEYKVIAIHFALPEEYAKHLNWYRAYTQKVKLIPDIAYTMYKKHYDPINKLEEYDATYTYIPKLDADIFRYVF